MKQQVLVFTPTIALMQDQVKQLQSKDIPAIVLGDNGESMEDLLLYNNQPLIAYLTPEYIYGSSSTQRLHILKQLAENKQLALIAIDEAHLLFEWEHFRQVSSVHVCIKFLLVCYYIADQLSRIFRIFLLTYLPFLSWLWLLQHHLTHWTSLSSALVMRWLQKAQLIDLTSLSVPGEAGMADKFLNLSPVERLLQVVTIIPTVIFVL